jgi:hypothetical protein
MVDNVYNQSNNTPQLVYQFVASDTVQAVFTEGHSAVAARRIGTDGLSEYASYGMSEYASDSMSEYKTDCLSEYMSLGMSLAGVGGEGVVEADEVEGTTLDTLIDQLFVIHRHKLVHQQFFYFQMSPRKLVP